MTDSLLELKKVSIALGGREIVRDVSFNVATGQIVTLIGPNGAGKTTLVRAVLGLCATSSGHIHTRPGLRVGYMPQRLHINAHMPLPVLQFLQLGGASRKQVLTALRETGIERLQAAAMQDVSGGELQRILLARALLREPQLLVLDEPVQGVDLGGQTELYDLITKVRNEHGCGVLMVSHDLQLVMATTDTVVCLNHHVCCHGHPDHVSNDPAFIELFGEQYAQKLAVYHHHHDHDQDIHGDIVTETNK
ncbi:MAG: zinc ABC transporter ATP-binding protein ZnuC [Pseudomonadales bacterium]